MKKRSCRRTAEETETHDRAVAMRKMTDDQLVEYYDSACEKSYSQGYKAGRNSGKNVMQFIDLLQQEKIPGIGKVTVKKLVGIAIDKGFIRDWKKGETGNDEDIRDVPKERRDTCQ